MINFLLKRFIQTVLLCLGLSYCLITQANTCPNTGVYLQVLGSGGPELDDGMASSGYAIWVDGKIRVLVDTGTGTATNFGRTGQPFNQVELILFSHFHSDHSADFAAYIKNAFFQFRDNDLWVYGPSGNRFTPGTTAFAHRFIGKNGVYPYLSTYLGDQGAYHIHLHDITPSATPQSFTLNDIHFTAIDAEHGGFPSLAWRVEIAGKSITFSGDNSGKSDYLITLSQHSDLLVIHNAIPPDMSGIAKRLHMTPARIGVIAQQAQPTALLLSHFMKRTQHLKKQTQKEIKATYTKTINLAKDLNCYAVGDE